MEYIGYYVDTPLFLTQCMYIVLKLVYFHLRRSSNFIFHQNYLLFGAYSPYVTSSTSFCCKFKYLGKTKPIRLIITVLCKMHLIYFVHVLRDNTFQYQSLLNNRLFMPSTMRNEERCCFTGMRFVFSETELLTTLGSIIICLLLI